MGRIAKKTMQSFRLSDETKKQLETIADKERCSLAKVIEELVEEKYNKLKGEVKMNKVKYVVDGIDFGKIDCSGKAEEFENFECAMSRAKEMVDEAKYNKENLEILVDKLTWNEQTEEWESNLEKTTEALYYEKL